MAATASSWKSDHENGNQMEIERMFDLDLALVFPQLAVEDISTSTRINDGTDSYEEHSLSLVSNMPTVIVSPSSTDVCPICMEELLTTHHPQPPPSTAAAAQEEEAKRMPCNHIFHSSCLSAWVSLHRSCPLCRSFLS